MAQIIAISGYLVYARSTERVPVTVTFSSHWQAADAVACQIGQAQTSHHITSITPPEGRAPRILTLDNGNKIFLATKDITPELAALLNQGQWQRHIDKAERTSLPRLILLSLCATVAFGATLWWVLPKLGDEIANIIPDTIIEDLSDSTLDQLDLLFFEESKLINSRQAEITKQYEILRDISGLDDDVTLLFRSSPSFGANALALPGGPVILLDELEAIAPSDEGIYAVLAHELAHIHLGHNRKRLARDGLYSLITVMIGGAEAAANGSALLKLAVFSGYSREFETQADKLARQWVTQAGYDPKAFDAMLTALYNQNCDDTCTQRGTDNQSGHHHGSGDTSSWFDSHPSLSERLAIESN